MRFSSTLWEPGDLYRPSCKSLRTTTMVSTASVWPLYSEFLFGISIQSFYLAFLFRVSIGHFYSGPIHIMCAHIFLFSSLSPFCTSYILWPPSFAKYYYH